ncbi:unnamed protein product [Paramecium sonneborni]|uniref:Uncharacterized protein n=1 Tax=Paramecium sonneborni TaxID=65129 RepID=A0A8S1QFP5_9CILI|nr:unnamed protein product [Paramecium sonneborni]
MQNSIKAEIKNLLNRIESLENSVLTVNSIQSKELLQQALDDFETYFDNITDMTQKLDISMVFLKELSKVLKHIKSQIDQVLQNVNNIANDVRKLRGKNYFELLLIRKDQILKQKDENDLDQIHIEILTQEQDPISGNKINRIKRKFIIILKEKQMNFYGIKKKEQKMLCFQKEEQVQGKVELQKILRNLYELGFQFMYHDLQQKIQNIIQLIQELESENYRGCQTWFYGKGIQTLKEVELLPISTNQSNEYLIQYSKVSVKRTIKRDFMNFLSNLKYKTFHLMNLKLFGVTQKKLQERYKTRMENYYFNQKILKKLYKKIQQIQFLQLFNADQMVSLNKDLLQLWGYQKFSQTIQKVKIQHLLNTTFMLEIIVYVLPRILILLFL